MTTQDKQSTWQTVGEMTFEQTRALQQDKLEAEERMAAKAQEEQTKRSKYDLREARQETYQIVGGCFAVAAVIITIALFIFLHSQGPEPVDPEPAREQACIDNGGGWVPSSLTVGNKGLCVYPGDRS